MSIIAKNYAEYLCNSFNWNYFLTLRTPYKIHLKTPRTWSNRILENTKVDKVFYVVERDIGDWSNKHVHMLLETNQKIKYHETRAYLGNIAVGDFQYIKDKKAVSHYVSKWIEYDCDYDFVIKS